MQIRPIKTRIVNPPKDDIISVINEVDLNLKEGDVLLVSSKIVAISQGRTIPISEVSDKNELIKFEADKFVPREEVPGGFAILTIKNNALIATSGIDESNANGHYILLPENTSREAKKICEYLKVKFNLNKLAVIIADSHSTPLRFGVTGISLGSFGLKPLLDYRGSQDIFGREIKISRTNVVDSLAAAGVLVMGEGNECTPLAVISDAGFVEFTNEDVYSEILVPFEDDLYKPLFEKFRK